MLYIQGSRTVGLPLLVHRRCANPMFGVSNAIAYQRLMVHSTPSRPSRIRDVLGSSRWLNVQGSANDKWCPEEGKTVLKLLKELLPLSALVTRGSRFALVRVAELRRLSLLADCEVWMGHCAVRLSE
jgi:hypothetical protein